MIHIDAALAEILTSKPYEYVIAGTIRDYRTYLWSRAMYDIDDASHASHQENLKGVHHAVIVLAGDRFSISPAYDEDLLAALSVDNVIVERGLGGNTRKYWYAAE